MYRRCHTINADIQATHRIAPHLSSLSTQWSARVLFPLQSMVLRDPHKVRKLVACGKMTFDKRVVLHRVGAGTVGRWILGYIEKGIQTPMA